MGFWGLMILLDPLRTFLEVQWLRVCASNAEVTGSIHGQGTKIPHATWHDPHTQNNSLLDLRIYPALPLSISSSLEMWQNRELVIFIKNGGKRSWINQEIMTCPQNKSLQRIQLIDSKHYICFNISLLLGAVAIKKNCTYKRMLIVHTTITNITTSTICIFSTQ